MLRPNHLEDDAASVAGSYPPSYQTIEREEEINETASIRDDGRIDVSYNSKLTRALSLLVPPEYAPRVNEKTISSDLAKPAPARFNIVIQVAGSRGDVQPFVALGTALQQQHGHRVRLATHNVFESFVRDAGLEFYPIGGDPHELMAYIVKNPGLIPSIKTLRAGEVQKKRTMLAEMLEGCWKSCIEPDLKTGHPFVADAIIANPPSFAHIHCAQALSVPLHMMFTMPWSSTRAFPHPLANLKLAKDTNLNIANYISYGVVEWMTWQGMGDVINRWRRHTLDLEAIPLAAGPNLVENLAVPHTYCWSPALVPKPMDWPAHIDVCGFFFRKPPTYEPPDDLKIFLEAGSQPVYIGFGSIVVDDATAMTRIVMETIEELGIRAIISRGWSKLGGNMSSTDKIFFLDDCPHEWLFQHVAAVCHHGGAGTTACGLLNSKPTTIVPFFGDQPFWGDMVHGTGAGPKPLPHRSLTTARLVDAIAYCLTAGAKEAAQEVAVKMSRETGVEAAVASFHRNLPQNLGCDVLPKEAAVWIAKRTKRTLRLSKKAAAALIDNGQLDAKSLKPIETKPLSIDPKRWDPATAMVSTMLQIVTNMGTKSIDVVAEPIREYKRMQAQGTESSDPSSSELGTGDEERERDPARAAEDSSSEKLDIANNLRPASKASTDRSASLSQPTPSSPRTTTWPTGCSISSASRSVSHASALRRAAIAGNVALTTAKSLGSLIAIIYRGAILDIPLAAADGLLALPGTTYDKQAHKHAPITSFSSGCVAAGKNFTAGMYEGSTSIFTKTYERKQDEGAKGVVKGLGEGVGNFVLKGSGSVVGLVAYPMLGGWRSMYKAVNWHTADLVTKAKQAEGAWLVESSSVNDAEVAEILQKYALLVKNG